MSKIGTANTTKNSGGLDGSAKVRKPAQTGQKSNWKPAKVQPKGR